MRRGRRGGAHLRRDPRRRARLAVAGGSTLGGLLTVAVLTLPGAEAEPGWTIGVPPVAARPVESAADATATTRIAPTTTTTAPRRPVTIAFVGDIHVEGPLRSRLADDPDGFVGPFAIVLDDADLVVGNLEAAVATGGRAAAKEFTFRAPPEVLDALEAGGVDVVSVANNHGVDFGPDALDETIAVARGRDDGMVVGVGADEDEAYAPHVTEVGGWRIAVLAATQVLDGQFVTAWSAGPDEPGLASAKRVDRLVRAVEEVRPTVDTVVVFLHWGIERETCPSAAQRDLAADLVAAGADVVVGGHAHRVQGGGMLGDAAVHYGLGNFLFGATSEPSRSTGVFRVDVAGRDVRGYEWVPGRILGSVPEPLTGDRASAAVAAWEASRSCTGLDA